MSLWAKREFHRGDVIAGVTVAVMLVPQGMAYAMLAGLPPVVGLYASIVPVFIYGLLGTSGQLAVGPVAMVSLLVAAGVGAVAEPGSGQYLALAVLLAVMVGVMQLAMGLARLGFLVNFLSHPVVSGFTSAAALIIGISQLKHVLGFPLARDHRVQMVLWEAWQKIDQTHLPTLAFGATSVLVLLAVKRISRKIPGALVVVVAGTLVIVFAGPDALSVRTVGEVPGGFPSPTLPTFEWSQFKALLPIAIAISLVGFMESISVAKYFASRYGDKLDANRELVALGLANLGGAVTGGYPVTGGFSRSAVNADAGARSGMASVITAVLVLLTLLFLTDLITHLPVAVLAAIILVAVLGLVDLHAVRHLWEIDRPDLGVLLVTFGSTLTLGIEAGIGVGVAVSMLVFVVRRSRPFYAVLGRLPETTIYRNVDNFPEVETIPGLLVLRFDAAFYFGNVSFLKDRLEVEEGALDAPLQAVILDAAGINGLDSSGVDALREIADAYRARGIAFRMALVKAPVRAIIERAGLAKHLDGIYLGVHDAVCASLTHDEALTAALPCRQAS